MMEAENFDVIVVGAGWNGLISAYTYLQLAPSANLLVVDDGQTVGGCWSKEKIYPTLFAQISHPLFQYSFFPMPREGVSSQGYIPANTIHEYLVRFATEFDLIQRIRLQTRVARVEKRQEPLGWVLETSTGHRLSCEKLIYATGPTSNPIIPSFPRKDFDQPVVHTQYLNQHMDYIHNHVQRATVVGAAKSSYDVVFLLLKAGKKVDWVIRESPSGPFAISAPTFLGLWSTAEHVSTRMAASFSPCIMNTNGGLYRFLQRSSVGHILTRVYWRTSTFLSAQHAGYSKSPNAEMLRPHPPGYGMFWGSGGLGIVTVPDFWRVFHAGDVTMHRTEIESLSHRNVVNFKNGRSVATDMVITCTGYDKAYQAFSPDLQRECNLSYDPHTQHPRWSKFDARGEEEINRLLPMLRVAPHPPFKRDAEPRYSPNRHYRRLVVPHLAVNGDRSVFFPGSIHSGYTPLTGEVQALWGVAFMLGLLDLPSQEEMEQECATFNAWARKRYLEQGKKHAYMVYDYISYIDTLMRDLGLRTKRKNNPVAELLSPYRPQDYCGLISEFLESRNGRVKH
ncbi:cofactor FMO1 FAD enzyme [Aspergillus egyptiacus]|nr:cofactor FMO1 FAD enzyme [Aspergillus egyptiacus]